MLFRVDFADISASSIDIPFSEGPVNLSWPAIMKTVQEDPKEFFAEGGWDFLGGSGDAVSGESPLRIYNSLLFRSRTTLKRNPRKSRHSRQTATSLTMNHRKAARTLTVRLLISGRVSPLTSLYSVRGIRKRLGRLGRHGGRRLGRA